MLEILSRWALSVAAAIWVVVAWGLFERGQVIAGVCVALLALGCAVGVWDARRTARRREQEYGELPEFSQHHQHRSRHTLRHTTGGWGGSVASTEDKTRAEEYGRQVKGGA